MAASWSVKQSPVQVSVHRREDNLVPDERFIAKSEACNDMQDCLSQQIELTLVRLVVGDEVVTGALAGAYNLKQVNQQLVKI